MTRLDALRDLLERVEEETALSVDFMDAFPERHEHWDEDPAAHALSAYHGSLDAAKALHEAVLPGWVWWFEPFQKTHFVGVYSAPNLHIASNDIPARAWFIAILKALIATEDNERKKDE